MQKEKQLNGSLFILGILVSVTSLYSCYGPSTQKTLADLNLLLIATIFTCCFIIVTSIIIMLKKFQQEYSRDNAEIKFCVLQGLASLSKNTILANKGNIRNLIIREDNTPQISPRTKTKEDNFTKDFEIILENLI